ncbi:MAG TPA: type VI secretion system protein TssA [Candidatus Binatia bacterium]|nr:type VI secretion system protein TssA [Candidatus Binatia bacterium]
MADREVYLSNARESPPCGPNLEHDLAFFDLEEAVRGKPEQSVGDIVKPGEEPDWANVVDLAGELLARSKDLRVAVHLTRALVHTEGMPGLATGLAVIHGLLERYWDDVHPQLEADNDNDPTERVNALASLADPETILKDLRDVHLISSRELGNLRTRDLEVALGRLAPARGDGAAMSRPLSQIHAQMAAAFATDGTVPAALGAARTTAVAIQALLGDHIDSGQILDLKPLVQSLDVLLEACDKALGIRGTAATDDVPGRDVGAAGSAAGALALNEIASREQALKALELVSRYLERHEPSNPAPLFIRRAQRLMTKNFVEIVKDLMPDSLAQLEQLAGEVEKTPGAP